MTISPSYVSGAASPAIVSDVTASPLEQSTLLGNVEAKPTIPSSDAVTISSAGQEAQRASRRSSVYPYEGASAGELQTINSRVQKELSTAWNQDGLALNAAQLPVPATPDRIANAKSATAFVEGDRNQPNPFASLSRTALTQIVYDESGKYTVNEREAAWAQQENNDSAFLTAASNKSLETGNQSYLYSALVALDEHKLPIEKALPSETAPLATTTQQLKDLMREYGGSESDNADYPGGWTL